MQAGLNRSLNLVNCQMYVAISVAELFRFAECVQRLTSSLRLQEEFNFITLDDNSSAALAKVERMIQEYIGEDRSAVQKTASYYTGE